MNRLPRAVQLIGLNAIPVAGVVAGGWSNPTALAVYWCETVMLILLVSARIHVHRKLTRKRGHFVEKKVRSGGREVVRGFGYFGTNFFFFSIIFAFFNSIFLSWAIGEDGLNRIDKLQLQQGVEAVAAMLVLGFLMDLQGIRARPFAWIKQMSAGVLWRGFLVQLAIIAGVIGAHSFGLPRVTLLAFVALKLYTDTVSQLSPGNAPIGPGSDADRARRAAAEEERFSGKPIPYEDALIQRIDGPR